MSLTLSTRPTIVDRFIPKSISSDIALVVAGAALTALAAQVSIPMWPVPLTGQTFAVLLTGAVLGLSRGTISMALYVFLGSIGLPIFTGGKSGFIFGPTIGYLVGFIAAAAVVGYFSSRQWDKKWFAVALGLTLGNAVIYAFGLPVLSEYLHSVGYAFGLQATLSAGLYPFIVGDAIKIALASTLLPGAWALVKKFKG